MWAQDLINNDKNIDIKFQGIDLIKKHKQFKECPKNLISFIKNNTTGIIRLSFADSQVKPQVKTSNNYYYEPVEPIISRSGDECVVAFTDQWFITYGEDSWRQKTASAINKIKIYSDPNDKCRKTLEKSLKWLEQWACSRSYGLGTRLPQDPQYLIESLSDSTVYMAYYTVAHLLQGIDNLDGHMEGPLQIRPEDLTCQVWDYIFDRRSDIDIDLKDSPVTNDKFDEFKHKLDRLRSEFKYWYPWDLRCSGKDLINNHILFSMYQHVALFQEKYYPQGVRLNGYLLLNKMKMSKHLGNFLTMTDACHKYTADIVRTTLSLAGDGLNDGNFEEADANALILRMSAYITWCQDIISGKEATIEKVEKTDLEKYLENIFDAEINYTIMETKKHYDQMNYREAVNCGLFNFQQCKDDYLKYVDIPDKRVILRFIEVQALIMYPIMPHLCEYILVDLLKSVEIDPNVSHIKWPTIPSNINVDNSIDLRVKIIEEKVLLERVIKSIRGLKNKLVKKTKVENIENIEGPIIIICESSSNCAIIKNHENYIYHGLQDIPTRFKIDYQEIPKYRVYIS